MRGRRRSSKAAGQPAARYGPIDPGLPITYCEDWNHILERPQNPISEAEARCRHETGELYAALVGDPMAPTAMVQVRLETGFVAAEFFDDHRRIASSYVYQEHEGRLYFSSNIERQWNKKGALHYGSELNFKPDGHLYVRELDAIRNIEETYEQWVTIDWEAVPAFGHYAGVLNRDRDVRPLDGPPDSPPG